MGKAERKKFCVSRGHQLAEDRFHQQSTGGAGTGLLCAGPGTIGGVVEEVISFSADNGDSAGLRLTLKTQYYK